MNLPIYLDYASTTPVDPAVADKMMQFLTPTGSLATRRHAPMFLVGRQRPRLKMRAPMWPH